jgi:hypothetical protein
MGKLNLTDAAKAILSEDAKSMFASNVANKMGMRGQDQHKHGQVGQDKLTTDVAYGTKDAGKVGDSPEKDGDQNPDYTKGTPTATPPGAKPPVGAEGAHHLDADKDQQSKGRGDLAPTQAPATDYSAIRDRIKARLATQMFQTNPGAIAPYVPEEVESDEEVVAEEKEKEEGHEDEKQDKALFKKMFKKETAKKKMKEDIEALVAGENLSEEFVQKASTIFEAAVITRAEEMMAEAEEAIFEEFEVAVEEIKEELASKLDDYINYMAEEWFKENQLAVEQGLRAEIVEDFMQGLRDLFAEHYIDIPEDKVDIVGELTNKVEELEEALNEQIKYSMNVHKELKESKKIEAIHAVCEGLTQTQVEKLKTLAESVEFTDEEEFTSKLETLKESYFKTPVKATDSLNEEVQIEEDKKPATSFADPSIEQYAKVISKTLVK